MTGTVDRERSRLEHVRSRPCLAAPHVLVDARAAEVTALVSRARRCTGAQLDRAEHELLANRARVAALSPQATLARGYAVVQLPSGAVVRDPGQVVVGERLRVRLAEGELGVSVR
jgi:exodeoxyribonuclease VII large subunit